MPTEMELRKLCRLFLLVALLPLASCNGLFEGIYDSPDDMPDGDDSGFGFVGEGSTPATSRIYIDATSYTSWIYLDFHNRKATALEIEEGEEAEPLEWDLAIHRYDAKTHSGLVLASGLKELSEAAALTSRPGGAWTADVWTTDKISIDMSHMMEGYIIYAESFYNPVLSGWLNVDTSEMPPIYTLDPQVYIVEFADGTHAALRLMDFMDKAGVKGYMTIDYIYPLAF